MFLRSGLLHLAYFHGRRRSCRKWLLYFRFLSRCRVHVVWNSSKSVSSHGPSLVLNWNRLSFNFWCVSKESCLIILILILGYRIYRWFRLIIEKTCCWVLCFQLWSSVNRLFVEKVVRILLFLLNLGLLWQTFLLINIVLLWDYVVSLIFRLYGFYRLCMYHLHWWSFRWLYLHRFLLESIINLCRRTFVLLDRLFLFNHTPFILLLLLWLIIDFLFVHLLLRSRAISLSSYFSRS